MDAFGRDFTRLYRLRPDGSPGVEPLEDDAKARRKQIANALRDVMLMVLRHELDEALVFDGGRPWWPGSEHAAGDWAPSNAGWREP